MTTTEPTTRVAPAWLNLDELCPPDVRAEIASLTTAIRGHLAALAPEIKRARYYVKAIEASNDEAGEYLRTQGVLGVDLHPLMFTMTGVGDLWDALAALAEAIDTETIQTDPAEGGADDAG